MANPFESASAIVPDLFYDLIARVVPGASCLAALVFLPPKERVLSKIYHEHDLWFLIFGGYVLGLLLTGASAFIFDLVLAKTVGRCCSDEWGKAIGGTEHYNDLDDVSKKDREAGYRLWKMAAEKVCFENGFVGLFLVAWAKWNGVCGMAMYGLVFVGLLFAWGLRVYALRERMKQLEHWR